MDKVANLYTLPEPTVDKKAPPGPANERWDNHRPHAWVVSPADCRKPLVIIGGVRVGMERTAEGTRKAICLVREYKSDFLRNVKMTGRSDEFACVAASGFGSENSEPMLHKEELTFEPVELKQRSH